MESDSMLRNERTKRGDSVKTRSVVLPSSVVIKPSRWELEEDRDTRSVPRGRSISSVVVRVDQSSARCGQQTSSVSRHSLRRSPVGRFRDERSFSVRQRRTYTGYDYHRRSPSPVRQPTEEERVTRPSPPKDMPEHIRWLHERWCKYDRTFFTGGDKQPEAAVAAPSAAREDQIPSTSSASARTNEQDCQAKRDPKRAGNVPRESRVDQSKRDKYSVPYYQFRKGGTVHAFAGGVNHPMMTLREFIVTQPGGLADDERQAMRLFEEYKLEYKRRMYADFFQAHQDDEWFLETYHPILRVSILHRWKILRLLCNRRQLLVRGWMETRLDVEESRALRKLMDACIVLMEGGDENDVAGLSDLDYVLEEKKEEAVELRRLEEEAKARDAAMREEDEDEEGQKPKRPKLREDDEEEHGEKRDPEELEIMQHAKDYSLYVKDRLQEEALDFSDQPDLLSLVQTKTKYVGDGMFVQEVVPSAAAEDETTLHKVSAVIIRNIPPFAKRHDLELMCSNAHGGYLRLHLSKPDPNDSFMRYAVASFWSNANLQKICWTLRSAKIGAYQLSVSEYRDFGQRRVAFVDGLAADKAVALRDIQLCKSLIEYLDKKHRLWEAAMDQAPEEVRPPAINPLLVNLDECLAFHLQQLIESGRLGAGPANGNLIDRDENLLKILDRLILYLRIVHSIDYYGCHFYETEDEEPRRIGLVHIRGPVLSVRPVTSRKLTTYIRDFETKLKDILPADSRLSQEHVELLGKRSAEEETDRYVRANIVAAEEQGMAQCCMCLKRFTSQEFARTHVTERHSDRFEEIKWIVVCFNNYLADPNRPCNPPAVTAV